MSKPPPSLEFWRQRYQSGETRWDLGEVSPPARLLCERYLAPGARVLVPGCGVGHEALWLARRGHQVTAVDFAPEAIAALTAHAEDQSVTLDARQANVFSLPASLDGQFDAVLEQACMLAMGPAVYAGYEALVWRLLRPGGQLLGVFMEVEQPIGPPPFSVPPDVVRGVFAPPRWKLDVLEPQPRNPQRPGREYIVRATKSGG